MKKKVLLTGATGFVGSNFLKRHGNDFDITCLDLRKVALESTSFAGYDSLVHCAALVHQMQGAPEQEYFKVNYELTKALAEKAKQEGVKHFIFISTAHVYGDSGSLTDHQTRLTEETVCHPHDPYGRSKLAAEEFLLTVQSNDFTVSIIRPPMVYGKGAKGNIVSLAKLIKLCPLLPLDYTKNRRSIVFVGNLCHFIALTVEKKAAGILLPQDAEAVSISTLVKEIAGAMDRKVVLFSIPSFLLTLIFKASKKLSLRLFGSLAMDSSASNKKLGYTAKYSTREGLRELVT
ncbi:NAD-dependent epimerase/dehydratase family protein [Bdellovibrio bacteriovorus]|uniref:NAD-dependent epimerase/dehydratase family protein n=1 Tax=Bdellovibrio bacteriovorus TaxID=959 RepID=UPI0035A6E926